MIRGADFIHTKQPANETSYNAKSAIKNDQNKQLVVIIDVPKDPKYLPNKPDRQEPVIDRNISNKYMNREGGT